MIVFCDYPGHCVIRTTQLLAKKLFELDESGIWRNVIGRRNCYAKFTTVNTVVNPGTNEGIYNYWLKHYINKCTFKLIESRITYFASNWKWQLELGSQYMSTFLILIPMTSMRINKRIRNLRTFHNTGKFYINVVLLLYLMQ